ncbi:cytochrome C oxidase copper chaperone [Conidiobolus coronatus NRRL 28638]|uniref:Cytochrome C oxidase copper chaperone n=1 Tax=Conidiobolus coronatus (strain ATCC 28846 / CBS 209.66 / NRRL 28638) TaxID=796925 RepID=A0A137PAE0_CONC2|nr:cytochrome C oxidase copper chaperone [Conidiobolus coronatus NRRL 28638]|eukprot:KXN71978.1 cytochrome C oxidase copper chaperone [Conidiobolus coronatus NRRL 28638]
MSTTDNNTTQTANKETTRPKPCCACPETKKARDECIFLNGEENCLELIEAHKACMRSYGFNI